MYVIMYLRIDRMFEFMKNYYKFLFLTLMTINNRIIFSEEKSFRHHDELIH